MNLETKYDDKQGLIIVDNDNQVQYVCSDKTDMDILCQKVSDELNYVILRHNILVRTMVKVEGNLREAYVSLKKLEEEGVL